MAAKKTKILIGFLFLVLSGAPSLFGEDLKALTVEGLSMMPTLMPGDVVVFETEGEGAVARDKLATVRFQHQATPMVIRIVAIPGDRVEIKKDLLLVNGEGVRSVNLQEWNRVLTELSHSGGLVPEKHYLILGDNPQNSRVHRMPAFIGRDRILGPVVWVFSSRPELQDQMVPGELSFGGR